MRTICYKTTKTKLTTYVKAVRALIDKSLKAYKK